MCLVTSAMVFWKMEGLLLIQQAFFLIYRQTHLISMRLKHIKLFEDFQRMDEKAVTIDEVLSNEKTVGAIKVRKKRSIKEHLEIVLFDFKRNIVEGYIHLERFKNDKEFMISDAYAIDKHGPMMYELALSDISPDGIIPARTIRPGALKVWDYFLNKRSDIKKRKMTPKDEWFTKEYSIDAEHDHLTDQSSLDILNHVYYVDRPIEHADDLFERGNKLLLLDGRKTSDIVKAAEKAFKQKYIADYA